MNVSLMTDQQPSRPRAGVADSTASKVGACTPVLALLGWGVQHWASMTLPLTLCVLQRRSWTQGSASSSAPPAPCTCSLWTMPYVCVCQSLPIVVIVIVSFVLPARLCKPLLDFLVNG